MASVDYRQAYPDITPASIHEELRRASEFGRNMTMSEGHALEEEPVQVSACIRLLEKSMMALNEQLHELGARLSPILLERKGDDGAMPGPPRPPMCELASCLDQSVRAVGELENYARYLIDSVQL